MFPARSPCPDSNVAIDKVLVRICRNDVLEVTGFLIRVILHEIDHVEVINNDWNYMDLA